VSTDAVRLLSLLLLPIIPDMSNAVLNCLGVAKNERTAAFLRGGLLAVGSRIVPTEGVIFKKAVPKNREEKVNTTQPKKLQNVKRL
jgi:methionyl-tRNA synthetase